LDQIKHFVETVFDLDDFFPGLLRPIRELIKALHLQVFCLSHGRYSVKNTLTPGDKKLKKEKKKEKKKKKKKAKARAWHSFVPSKRAVTLALAFSD
jgi:hypothetical protein